MNDPTSEKAVSDLVLLSRCRAAKALGLNLSPSEVMTLAAIAAERDRLAEENARLRYALQVYADGCDATETSPCGYEGNLCCMTDRAALKGRTDDR